MRQRFVAGVGGTLSLLPPEIDSLGVPASATVTLRHSSGADLPAPVTDAVAVVDPITGKLSYALSGAQCPLPGATTGGLLDGFGDSTRVNPSAGASYRAEWKYVIAGVTYDADQLYEVRRRILHRTLTYAEVERDLPAPVLDLSTSTQKVRDAMDDAWDDVLDDLATRGFEPDRVMDSDRLRRPHREKVVARLARSWGPNWRQYATDREDAYQRAIDAALAAGDWYDAVEDAVEARGEIKTPSTTLTR